jgi:hypothetical protein
MSYLGLSMIMSPHSDSEVIIGSETGHIFRANLDKATPISGSGIFAKRF